MASRHRILMALGAFFVLAFVLGACGGVPGNGVARVDDKVIKKKTFDHWMKVAAQSSQAPGQSAGVTVPDAPKYTKCIATKAAQQQRPTPGQPKQTPAQLKAVCQQEYASLRDQVMQFLISADWLQGEASDQGVKVSKQDLQKEFQKQKQQSFPKEADYQKFLQSSGMSQDDILLRVKLDLLSTKIRNKVTKGKSKVSDKQARAYYAQNQSRFGQPQRRDLLVVLTKTAAKANQAKSELSKGKSFAAVAKSLSIDEASKSQGGKLSVSKGQQEKALDDAVFGAPLSKLVGPVKTQFGYYVFKATKDTPGSQQSFEQAKPTIERILTQQNQQAALQKFVKKFQKKWKGRTDCRKEFVVQTCSNAPKPKAGAAGAAPGAVPQQGGAQQGGGAQQVPQQGGAQQVPQQGGAQQVPQQGGAQQVPQQGGGAQQAPSGP